MSSKILAAFEGLPLVTAFALVGALLTVYWTVVLFLQPLLSPFVAKGSLAVAVLATVGFAVAALVGIVRVARGRWSRNA